MAQDYIILIGMSTAEDFRDFLGRYLEGKEEVESIVIDFIDLKEWNSQIAEELIENPDDVLDEIEKSTKNFSKERIPVSINNLSELTSLRDLGSLYLGKLILLRGIINRVIPIRPMVVTAAYECKKCSEIKHEPQEEYFLVPPIKCGAAIGKKRCTSRKFRFLEGESEFVDVQELSMQEKPEDLPAGQLPRHVNLEIQRQDLINGARAGDIVNVVGVLRTKPSSSSTKKRKFAMFLDVKYIEALNKEIAEMKITSEEEQEICGLGMREDICELIVQSIAPSIYGNTHIKEAIMYLLFGGVQKDKGDIKIRGELNILLVGDPATAKSQLLQVTANISPRGLYTSGRGTSAAGLTAAVNKVEGDIWALDAGAMVLADKGICCIDEIDKMNDTDRVAIHEAMEQHKVSINKAGINARLNARTAVLSAANPDFGRYDKDKTIGEQIKKLPVTLLSRFDLIFLMRDKLEAEQDEALSAHILELKKTVVEMIPRALLKKYIAYARGINPKISKEAKERLQSFYQTMRKVSHSGNGEDNPVSITPRQLESLMRITEAHAKISLKSEADVEDAEAAIKIMEKSLNEVGLSSDGKTLDVDRITTGIPKKNRDKMKLILSLLEDGIIHENAEIWKKLKDMGMEKSEIKKLLAMLRRDAMIFEPKQGFMQKIR